MNKLRITLRWRITLLTIAIMLLSSIALVLFINMNVGTIMPQVTDRILNATAMVETNSSSLMPQEMLVAPGSTDIASTGIGVITIPAEMARATTDVYWGSFFILLVTIVVGGVCAYFVSGTALTPIRNLNERIKKVNANNLTSNLAVVGPQDEIKELTISFNSMLAKLENAFSSQKRFNASAAHELKTPLAVVKANIDVLNDQDDKAIADYQHTLLIVEQSMHKMNTLVEALLNTVQEENAPLDDHVKIDEVISDVAEDLQLIADRNNVHLTYDIKSVPVIMGNEVLLYRAIYNVCENALKYNTPQGNVTVSCNKRNEQVVIRVSDTGDGIPEEEIKRIFEPFYRIRNHRQQDGLGLGLVLTKSIIAIHGGEISVSSVIGQGTVFELKLPISKN